MPLLQENWPQTNGVPKTQIRHIQSKTTKSVKLESLPCFQARCGEEGHGSSFEINNIKKEKENAFGKFCPLKICNMNILGLLDTGADKTLISDEQIDEKQVIKEMTPQIKLHGVTGHKLEVLKSVVLKIKIGLKILQQPFHVILKLPYSVY